MEIPAYLNKDVVQLFHADVLSEKSKKKKKLQRPVRGKTDSENVPFYYGTVYRQVVKQAQHFAVSKITSPTFSHYMFQPIMGQFWQDQDK